MSPLSDQPTPSFSAPETKEGRVPINQATLLNLAVSNQVDDMFAYHSWDQDQTERGGRVRQALADAVKVIIANVPACPDRATAIRKIREARMDANSAITHDGKY